MGNLPADRNSRIIRIKVLDTVVDNQVGQILIQILKQIGTCHCTISWNLYKNLTCHLKNFTKYCI